MTETELLQVLARGEDSRHQFKPDATNADGLAAKMAAFANGSGGRLFLGATDDGAIIGLAKRVEIISPGHLPDSLTPEQMRVGVSNRRNPVLAEHAAHILPYRGLGTGIPRALDAWPKIDFFDERSTHQFREVVHRLVRLTANPQLPRQVTGEITPEVTPEVTLLRALGQPLARRELQAALKLKDDDHFRTAYLLPALEAGLIEMTIPDRPTSRLQKYRLSALGRARLNRNSESD